VWNLRNYREFKEEKIKNGNLREKNKNGNLIGKKREFKEKKPGI